MPIQLGISNSLKSLVNRLADRLQQTSSVFQPIYIITQTAGMNIWLKQQLAQKLGIAANIQFLKPNDAIHLIFKKLSGRYVFQSISAHDLNWLIYDILQEENFKTRFPKISEYYNQSGLEGEIKRMALAEKIADLFDQYQIYRAPEIENWNQNENWGNLKVVKNETDEVWQKHIWTRAGEVAGERFSDKTYIGKYILDELENPQQRAVLQNQIPALYFFGLSLITEYHLQIIYKVSETIPVEFLFQNPAPWKYWYDDKSEKIVDFLKRIGKYESDEEAHGNPLLTGLGKLTQNTFKMFFKDDDTLNTLEEYGVREPSDETLLHHIQNTIFNNEKQDIEFSNSQLEDGSVTINSCYSPIREVEVLYNYLVHLVDQKKEKISARDIIVMVSDIDLYGSYIKAVFDNAPYKFSYTIADESYVVSDTISNALHAILSLGENGFSSEKVVSLLDFSSIRKRFGIEDLELIRRAVDAANIRFGFSGNREEETHYVSWEYGLNRIMYGLCMQGENHYEKEEIGFYPIDLVEGFDMFKIVRFVHFVRVLKQNIQSRNQKRTIAEWVRYVEACLFTFIGEIDENPDEDYMLLQNQLEQYNRLQDLYIEKTDFEVFRYNFLPILSQSRRSGNFAAYGITFCSLIPMRSIPFKIVALLGMDLHKFPRLNRPVSFDLIEKKKQTGDRDLKENDKQLFLDTLLSAEEYFYVSFVGQSLKNNEAIPPSALVDEFVDFIASHAENPEEIRKTFIQKHPLHGFSRLYNTAENPKLYSYLLSQNPEEENLLGELKTPDFDFDEIDLHRLISFLKNPTKGYYQRVLNIYYQEDEIGLLETEKFDLDSLEKWIFKNELLGWVQNSEKSISEYISENKKKGRLPLKNMAPVRLSELEKEIHEMAEIFRNLTQGFEETKADIHIRFPESELAGKISGIYGENLVCYTLSSKDAKHKFGAYLEYLALLVSDQPKTLYFITKGNEVFTVESIDKKEAYSILENCISIFKNGHFELFPFHFDFGFKLNEIEDLSSDKFNKKLDNYFYGYQSYPEVYILKAEQYGAFREENSLEKFLTHAELFLEIVEHRFMPVSLETIKTI